VWLVERSGSQKTCLQLLHDVFEGKDGEGNIRKTTENRYSEFVEYVRCIYRGVNSQTILKQRKPISSAEDMGFFIA